jgi:hypothetical protein
MTNSEGENMKGLRLPLAAALLTMMLTLSASAGDMETTVASKAPSAVTAQTGAMNQATQIALFLLNLLPKA